MADTDETAPQIVELRGVPCLLDHDVAAQFGVRTAALNQAVKRNAEKFGDDFAFELTPEEFADLKSQNVIASGHGGRRRPPKAFTEHGVVMAATLLRSPVAIAASRQIVASFVATRRATALVTAGQNLPAAARATALVGAGAEPDSSLRGRLQAALNRVLDAIADPEENTSVRDEARSVALEGLGYLKARLKRGEIENEKTLAEIRSILTQAEKTSTEAEAQHIENAHRRMALLAKELQLILGAKMYLQTGETEGLMATLEDLAK